MGFSLINFLKNRGYISQCSDEKHLDQVLNDKKICLYLGIDCTAESLHIGNLVPIMVLRAFQKHGHKPILVIGGATTKIGDPSEKRQTRQELSLSQITKNTEAIKKSLAQFLKFGSGRSDAILLDNSSWWEDIGYLDFLRDYGKFFSVNKMLTMESVRSRLENRSHFTFLEFNYMLLQAYDFYKLFDLFDCRLQIGGNDQWGNITSGIELIKKISGETVHALTVPLLTTSSGEKMGKSQDGAVWIDDNMLSPYKFYQYWRNIDDRDVVKFAKIYCDFNDNELDEFVTSSKKDINYAKKQLAFNVTKLVHGVSAANSVSKVSKIIFEDKLLPEDLINLSIKTQELKDDFFLYKVIKDMKFLSSYSEAKKLILGKGLKINDELILDTKFVIKKNHFEPNKTLKISLGKKKHFFIKLVDE